MKPIAFTVASAAFLFSASAQNSAVSFSPQALTSAAVDVGDSAVWQIEVISGAIGAGFYEAWCFAPIDTAYGDADYGQSFDSTLVPLNSIIIHESSPGTNMANAMVNYLFDSHYGDWDEPTLSSLEKKERFRAFHHILWEIQSDYDPSVGLSSIDFTSGNHIVLEDLNLAGQTIFSNLTGAYSGLSDTYTSGIFDLKVIDGRELFRNNIAVDATYQPLLVVSRIPEPSALLLCGTTVGFLFRRRRRSVTAA